MKANNSKNIMAAYGSLAAQFLVGTAVTVYGGIWIDKKINAKTPVFTWVLPLLFIIGMLYKIIKDNTSTK